MDIDRVIKKKKRLRKDGNLKQLAEIVKELGDIYYETGKYENALQEYEEQLQICEVLGDKLNVAVAHRMIGEMHVQFGKYEEALEHQNHYLEGAKEMENLLEQQRAYATLGRTYFCLAESLSEKSQKRFENLVIARKAYMKSIRLCNDLGDTDIEVKELMTMRARLLLNLGLVMEAEKKHQEAIDLMEKAAGICDTHNLQEDFYRTQIALGGIYERKCDYDLALIHLKTATKIDNASLKAEARLCQVELLSKIGRWHESRKILVSLYVTDNLPANIKNRVEKILKIVATLHLTEQALNKEESTSGKLKLYETLGDASTAVHCFDKAAEYYKKMLMCAEEIKSNRTAAALSSLAQTLKDIQRYNEALEYARRELELCTDPREICRSALFLVELLIATNSPNGEIEETYNLALKSAKTSNDVSLEINVLQERLNFLNSVKDSDEKEMEVLKAKIDALEKLCNSTDSSDDESEDNNIGVNICLDDLSDVEAELEAKGNIRTRKRTRTKSVVVKRNEKGETQLHVACINGNIENVEKLLESGHAPNVRDHFGWTPLHEAANHGYVEIAKLLLKYGADVNDPGSLMCQGFTPLHDAASCGNIGMIRFLIDNGANVQLKTNEGDTVLDCLLQWRDRVDFLSPEEQVDYDKIYAVLSAMIPASKSKGEKRSYEFSHGSKMHKLDKRNLKEKISAGEDYKRTIASLKHRNDPIGIPSSSRRHNVKPLLNSEEVFLDDWLEDDMTEGTSDRKYSGECSSSMTKRKSSNGDIDIEKSLKKLKAKDHSPTSKEEESNVMSENSNSSCDAGADSVSNEWWFRKKKQQTSLLSVGFTKNSISRVPSPARLSPTVFESREIDNTKSVVLQTSVDGKVIKTQVEFSNTMKPVVSEILADIAAKFYNDTGCKAKLELKTMEDIVVNSNNVFAILNEGNIVKKFSCEITELETPSVIERYRTICKNYNVDVRECILNSLKSCENTSVVRLKQGDIKREELISFLKTIEYQKFMQILDLSGRDLHDIGNILSHSILRLSTLQELCLERCDIDSNCLCKLEKLPSQLRLLDLSYNPLGPKSEEVLGKLLLPLTHLRTLNLRYCELRNLHFLLNNKNLVNLDISWNIFREDGFYTTLQRQLLSLNLSNTMCSDEINLVKNIFNNSNLSFVNVECLELSSCNLTDIDVENILSRLSNLSKLSLRGNREIGERSLNLLLKFKPTLRHIDVSGCKNIIESPDPQTFIQNPEICTLIVSMCCEVCDSWLQLWRGQGVVHKMPHNLTIFKPSTRFTS